MRKLSSTWIVVGVLAGVLALVGLGLHLMGADMSSWTQGMRALHGRG